MDIEQKNSFIKDYLSKYNITFKYITDEKILNCVYDFYANGNESISDIGTVLNYYAVYYKIKGNINKMIKYYLMAIDKGDAKSMSNLGFYYYEIKDYPNMIKYYLMGVAKGHHGSMNNLGLYYDNIKDYLSMMKYYLMAIDKGSPEAMFNLGLYYRKIKDYPNMEKYYLMAVSHGCQDSKNSLSKYYYKHKMYEQLVYLYSSNNQEDKVQLFNALDLYLSQITQDVIHNKVIKIICELDLTGIKCSLGLRLLHNTLKEKIDTIDLHYNYSPDSKGCEQAKEDFMTRCLKN